MKKKFVLIFPFAKALRNGKRSAKNYPFWSSIIEGLISKGYEVVQVGIAGEARVVPAFCDFKLNLSLDELKVLIKECDFWISCDSFAPHLAHHLNKRGVVLWSLSDPNIFGYSSNINILKGRKYLRDRQFDIWEEVEFDKNAFTSPADVLTIIEKEFPLK